MNRKIFIVGGGANYANWMQGEIVDRMEEANLVLFTGGEDVSPHLYGEPSHATTMSSQYRDEVEVSAFERASRLGKKLIGICRGGQFLCVMAGGKLVQDQEIQPMYHWMDTIDGEVIRVSSTHHQAQWPWNLPIDDRRLIGYTQGLSAWHQNGNEDEIVQGKCMDLTAKLKLSEPEVEVCYYPRIKALAIQPHPEMYFTSPDPSKVDSIKYFRSLLDKHMNNEL